MSSGPKRDDGAWPAPRILYIDQTGKLGGAELSLLDIAKSIPGTVLLFEDGPFRERLEQAGVTVLVVKMHGAAKRVHRTAGLSHYVRAIPGLIGLLREVVKVARGYDIIYVNTQKAMVVGSVAGKMLGKPVVWALRDIMSAGHFSWLNRLLTVVCGNMLVARIVANSMATRSAFIAAGGSAAKCTVIYNGIADLPVPEQVAGIEGIPAEAPVLGHFGRLTAWKGQDVLLRALPAVPEAHALFVGEALFQDDRNYAESLIELTRELGLTKRVHWLGFRSDVAALMHRCSVVVHSSVLPEPFGRVIVEGMLAGKPVIATAQGGAVEIIENEVSGLLVPAGEPAALVAAVRKCLGNPSWTHDLAKQGRIRALQQFSLDSVTQRLGWLFTEVLQGVVPARNPGGKSVHKMPAGLLVQAQRLTQAVLFLDQTGQLGGAEMMLLDIAAAYKTRGLVIVLEDGPFVTRLRRCNVVVEVIPLAAVAKGVTRRATLPALAKSVPAMLGLVLAITRRSKEADVIYANTAKALFVGVAAGILSGRPVIYHLHDILDASHFSLLNRKLLVWASRLGVDAIIANSEATKVAFVRCGGSEARTSVIYNGFSIVGRDAAQSDPSGLRSSLGLGGAPVVVMAGRLTPWKGQHVLLDAMRRVPNWHAVIVGEALFTAGDRAYAERLREQAKQPDLLGRVHFVGFQNDMAPYYALAAVVAHCSTSPEPFGRVIVEAMLAGKPVIATDLGGAREIIRPGETGWLVPADDPAALAGAIRVVLDQPETVAKVGATAREDAAARFGLEAVLRQVDDVIMKVSAGRKL